MSQATIHREIGSDSQVGVRQAIGPRIDLHCHSVASTEADEAVLNALACPECYSDPADVYDQATRRGMNFVTLTDHDCIDGAMALASRSNVLIGEEVTCYFPEDRCKIHLLVWGITREDHDALQAHAADIYAVAAYVEERRIAHSVAHPLYRQNDRLGRWHLERLLLLFKGFECLNGAHSALHRDAFVPVLDRLTADGLAELADRHQMEPLWPEPWIKSRTGGSDDHGLLNIGRTWTEFPPEVRTTDDLLAALREGRCRPGGEAGSSLKLAHNFFSVGIRYYTRVLSPRSGRQSLLNTLLQTIVGERAGLRKRDLVKLAVQRGVAAAGRKLRRPFSRKKSAGESGTAMLGRLAVESLRKRRGERTFLTEASRRGVAPLGEHDDIFRLVAAVTRDTTAGLFASVGDRLNKGELAPLFDALSTLAAQQCALLPYYFALFHQNRERHLCGGITHAMGSVNIRTIRVGLFTDTFDEINGVARFLKRIGQEAAHRDRNFLIATCQANPIDRLSFRKNFEPAATLPAPHYPELKLAIPPVVEVLEWADRQQFDAIHISTPGPMGLVGWLVAKMLNVPVVCTHHTDFPAFVRELTGDHRLTSATASYLGWFYGNAATVFARSRSYEPELKKLGVAASMIRVLPPCTDPEAFNPRHRNESLYPKLGVHQPLRILYVGRISAEKNLRLLAKAFSALCETRDDVALVLVGDGPLLAEMKQTLAGRPACFLGYRKGEDLAALYASADLFVFPSCTDTLGQAVMEAQASGLPVLVSSIGGPREVMDDGVTGQIVSSQEPADWAAAIDTLLDDLPGRLRMARTAAQRSTRYTRSGVFETFWEQHVKAAQDSTIDDLYCEPKKPAHSDARLREREPAMEVSAP